MIAGEIHMSNNTPIAVLTDLFSVQQQAFQAQLMPSAEQRIEWLRALRGVLASEQKLLAETISADFSHRSHDETLLAELMPSLEGIDYACRRIKRWMKPVKRKVGLAFQPASAKIIYQPLGVVGVIVPWNYPLFLSIGPLTGALAAGNRVMIKMSEHTPRTAQLLKELLARVFPQDLVCVVQGEADIAAAFSELPFDHLLFTGSTQVGKHVMRAAANNLTPVTLELGGKSPAIISADVPLAEAAERIAFGKTVNAGQTCVAPDYILVPEARVTEFVEAMRSAALKFYPKLANNKDYTAIINPQHLQRLHDTVADATQQGAEAIAIYAEEHGQRFALTLLLNVTDDMRVMQDEIFGPILPIVSYTSLDDALAYIRQRPRPLALYYFGYERDEQQHVLHNSHAGGVCINDTLLHVAQHDLPFGGIGPSGMGHYHAHEGFLTFSHSKAVFSKQRLNAAKLIYPPYGGWLQKLIIKFFVR